MMKLLIALFSLLPFIACTAGLEDDYEEKYGDILSDEDVVSSSDDLEESSSSSKKKDDEKEKNSSSSVEDVSKGSSSSVENVLTDARDGRTYKVIPIGGQTWMAENLKYEIKDGEQSWCVRKSCGKIESSTVPEKIVLPGKTVKKLSVTMFDWLHGNNGDGSDVGTNGDPALGVSADFGSSGCNVDMPTKGMVETELGSKGVPVASEYFPKNCKNSTHLNSWFLPEVVAKDKDGKEYTNMACRDLYITREDDMWLAEISKNKVSSGNEGNKGGLFLLDDFEYLDEAKTVPNPYYDHIEGSSGYHNYGFTMKIEAQFEYVPGQYFSFYGDDDVWVFINNRLVVDIGGVHSQIAGAVNLDTLGLIAGQFYPFHIFYAERHRDESNFRMQTSIDLRSVSRVFATKYSVGYVAYYDIWEIVRESSCDLSSRADTVSGVSTFVLYGESLPKEGVILKSGDNYGGITINDEATSVIVDDEALGESKQLSPGAYLIRVYLNSDMEEYLDIDFIVEDYECSLSVGDCDEYGRLYTWDAAEKACPEGWRLPSDAEWSSALTYIGGESVAGKLLKSENGWNNKGNGSDDYGFAALPAGQYYNDEVGNAGYYAYFWSSSEKNETDANFWYFYSGYDNVSHDGGKKDYAFSVRCMKD